MRTDRTNPASHTSSQDVSTATPSTSVRSPEWRIDTIRQAGLKAYVLATTYSDLVEPRLASGLLGQLERDTDALESTATEARMARESSVASTAEQHDALERGYGYVTAVRDVVRDATQAATVRKAYGVGSSTSSRSVGGVTGALKRIIERVAAHPEEMTAFGITEGDIAGCVAALAEIKRVNAVQSKSRVSAPRSTATRNLTAKRIVRAIKQISRAGGLAFVSNKAVRDEFAALNLKSRRAQRRAAPPAPSPSAAVSAKPSATAATNENTVAPAASAD